MSGNTDFWHNDLFTGIGHPFLGNNLFGAERTMDAGAISLPLAEKSSRIGRQRIEPGNPPMMGLFTGRSPGPKQLSHEGKYAEEKVPMRVHSRAPKMSLLLNDNIMLEP